MTGYAVFAKIVGADASSVSLAREEFGDDHQRVSALDGGATPLDVIGPSGYIPGYSSSRGAQALWLGRSVVIKLRNDTVHRYEAETDVLGVFRFGKHGSSSVSWRSKRAATTFWTAITGTTIAR